MLLSRFDVLLLDEPTNDLDLEGLDRLEQCVAGLRGGLVVVSHDREFLARTITEVVELDPVHRTCTTYAGGWDAYLAEREVARRHRRERFDAVEARRGELVDRVQNAREQSVRGALRARNRASDDDKVRKGARVEAATKGARKVRALESRLTHLERDLGTRVVVGELDQARAALRTTATVVDLLVDRTDLSPTDARTLLAKFGLRGPHAVRPADALSPGERTRAVLALLMAGGTNLLVLDEPTNHLDLPAIEQLEEALERYEGTVVLVSHDRRLLDAVTTDRTWHVAAGQVNES